jgi:hypothetical protein
MERPGSQNQTIEIEVTWMAVQHAARAPPISAYRLKLSTAKREVIKEASVEVRCGAVFYSHTLWDWEKFILLGFYFEEKIF